ncbi:45945_t:CDS:2 [Gigaspora margarita]|uniref:45945_t:CDS:1 n=1 Tax=Gigaspora margarita TaxID=4874 RepID=A0ABN7V9V4_GIGMA|nr:45945_t:CDS:2 [Gigaspora margarita]
MLQRDKAHLFEVTFSMAYLLQFWKLNSDRSQEPKCILHEFNNFCIKNNPFDDETYQQFKDDVLSYWCYIKDATDELAQTMHANTQTTHSSLISTQINNNSTLTQTTHSNNIDSSDKIQNVDLGKDNKDEDNEEYNLPYISEAEFGKYLQEWVEILDEKTEVDIIKDQYDTVELDDVIHPAIDENAK